MVMSLQNLMRYGTRIRYVQFAMHARRDCDNALRCMQGIASAAATRIPWRLEIWDEQPKLATCTYQ